MTNVNEKSTKTEIWAAYKELQAKFQSQPLSIAGEDNPMVNELGVALEQTKTSLLRQFEVAQKVADSIANDYASAEQALAKRKSEIVDGLERSRAELQVAIDEARTSWERGQDDRKRAREREAEEYTYELNKKRRAEEEAFQSKWRAKFTELDSREATLKSKEDHLKQLEQESEAAPEKLQKTVEEACNALAKELKTTHDAELKELRQHADHQKSLLELKLQTAEMSVAAKDKQLSELQKQLESASAQLKDMAVTVIRASNTQNQPPASAS